MENKPPSSDHPRSHELPHRRIKAHLTGDNPFNKTERSDHVSVSYSIAGQELSPAEISRIALISDTIVAICGSVRKRLNGKKI